MPASRTSVEGRVVLCTQQEGRGCNILDVGSRVAEALAAMHCHVIDMEVPTTSTEGVCHSTGCLEVGWSLRFGLVGWWAAVAPGRYGGEGPGWMSGLCGLLKTLWILLFRQLHMRSGERPFFIKKCKAYA